MQSENGSIEFSSTSGVPLVLQRLAINGVLRDDLASIEVEQVYRNAEDVNIEATYTFPLPVGCVLLDLSVALNGRVLVGRVAPRVEAENQYEESLAQGDTGIMLIELTLGMYQMNVGNLLPGDEARIRMRYAMPLKWEGESLRLALPTTIAPRFGNPDDSGLKPYEVPVTDLLVENVYDLNLRIEGGLASLPVSSPSHLVSLQQQPGQTLVRLSGGSAMADRDFVLNLSTSRPLASSLRLIREANGTVAHAVFRIPAAPKRMPIVLKVLVDCSGSMNGDSMALARTCATHALSQLERGDLFSVSAFGSTVVHDPQFDGVLMPAGRDSPVFQALNFVNGLDANLGGTELERALASVYRLQSVHRGAAAPLAGGDVLLVTDGETWDHQSIIDSARRSGHRIFVIGIGSSPNAALVRDMARATGGSAVYLGPNEDLVAVVERQLARMQAARVVDVKLNLPGQVRWCSPERIESGVNPADTLHVFAMLDQVSGSTAELTLTYADGSVQTVVTEPCVLASGVAESSETSASASSSANDLCRIGVAQRIAERLFNEAQPNESELAALALEYRLHTAFTHYILTAERDNNASSAQPELRQVAQMLAAGWGGTSSVLASRLMPEPPEMVLYSLARSESPIPKSMSIRAQRMVAPAPLSHEIAEPRYSIEVERSPAEFVLQFGRLCNDYAKGGKAPKFKPSFRLLRKLKVPKTILADLEAIGHEGYREEQVVLAFLRALMDSPLAASFERPARREVIRQSVLRPPDPKLVATLKTAMSSMTAEAWLWVRPIWSAETTLCTAGNP